MINLLMALMAVGYISAATITYNGWFGFAANYNDAVWYLLQGTLMFVLTRKVDDS